MVIAFLMMNPFHHRLNPNLDPLLDGGEYNGYVAFDAKLPLSWQGGAPFEDKTVLDNMIDVHGGITLDRSMENWTHEAIIPLTAIPEPEQFKNLRVIGFDTLHYDDTKDKWPFDAIKAETLKLKEQIEHLISKQNK